MAGKDEIRRQFRELEKRIDELVHKICPPEPSRGSTETADAPAWQNSSLMVPLIGAGSATTSASRVSAGVADIVIPGITPSKQRPLIVPVAETKDHAAEATASAEEKENVSSRDAAADELVAAMEAPLVALGRLAPSLLEKAAESGCEWAQWWLDARTSEDRADRKQLSRLTGPWFSRSVIGSVSRVLLLDPPPISKAEQDRVVLPYVVAPSTAGVSMADGGAGLALAWQVIVSIVGTLASRNAGSSLGALTLATNLLDSAVALGQLSPRLALQRIDALEQQNVAMVRGAWDEYLQVACTLPERVANKVDPQSIPAGLVPQQYFAQLAKHAVECQTIKYASGVAKGREFGFVAELWTKLCRVGQADCLCVELAAALVTAAHERIRRPASAPDDDDLAMLAAALASTPAPLQNRLVSGVVRQMDIMASRYFAPNDGLQAQEDRLTQLSLQVALVICMIVHCRLDHNSGGSAVEEAVSSLLTRSGSATGSVAKWTTPTYQAIALALQLLSGKSPASGSQQVEKLTAVLPARLYPNLLLDSLSRCILPMWSFADFVAHGRVDEVKALTSLILMCMGGLGKQDRMALSMSAAFTRAIPRFLDAPTPLVRLSGVLVADTIVNSGEPSKGEAGEERIDFGLDDIIRDAKRADQLPDGQRVTKASAEYIVEMRRFARPIVGQWADMARGDSTTSTRAHGGEEEEEEDRSLAEAIKYIRAYNGDADKDDAVLAPRQSSMAANGEQELKSGYIKPRTPVFLRDCLAYLKDKGDGPGGTEKVKIGLFALASCIAKADVKTTEELWLQVANKVLYTYNRGPDDLDWMWDLERRRSLVALAVKLPEQLGPFLADRSCDRNLTIKDREIVFSAIATACLQLSGVEEGDKNTGSNGGVQEITQRLKEGSGGGTAATKGSIGSGTVVRRSRRLDLAKPKSSRLGSNGSHSDRMKQRYASIVGPAFFFPLIAQYGKSDMTASASDIGRDAGLLEKYLNTLGVILYTSGSASHQISMNREFWDLARIIRRAPGSKRGVSESPPVLDALLFGIDVTLSPDRALSVPTLAREFRGDIANMLQWIGMLLESNLLGPPAMAHASRIVSRLNDLQGEVYRRVMSSDFDQYTSIV
ncbi:hypothetical protein GQ54DRAFT_100621 [Martensiomyces pterosporus]|nr:hypothetical protein GQ54DRAFT_100621 [Martensiomyces pterosporus]